MENSKNTEPATSNISQADIYTEDNSVSADITGLGASGGNSATENILVCESTPPVPAPSGTTGTQVYITINSLEGPPRMNHRPQVVISIQTPSPISPRGTSQQPQLAMQVATNERRNSLSRNFWCHFCRMHMTEALTTNDLRVCPHCTQGFIEELPSESASPSPPVELQDMPSISRALRYELQEQNTLLGEVLSRPPDYTGDLESLRNHTTRLRDLVFGAGGGRSWVNALNGGTPMSQQQINDIPYFKITENEVDKKVGCSVCQDAFKIGEDSRKLDCGHLFHDSCILPWLRQRANCPNCRQRFATSAGEVVASIQPPPLRVQEFLANAGRTDRLAAALINWNEPDDSDVEGIVRRFSQ